MSTTSNAVAVPELSREQLNEAVTFDEAMSYLSQIGLAQEDAIFIASPYEVLNQDKDALLKMPFFIRNVSIGTDQTSGNSYSVLYVVTKDNRLYVVTDGSTGIHAQLAVLVAKRQNEGHPTPTQNILVPNGLRKSEYGVGADGKPVGFGEKAVSTGVTYYLA